MAKFEVGKRLEMITPIRGRKLYYNDCTSLFEVAPIRNDNPDKGTETDKNIYLSIYRLNTIRNDNPDKGTETGY